MSPAKPLIAIAAVCALSGCGSTEVITVTQQAHEPPKPTRVFSPQACHGFADVITEYNSNRNYAQAAVEASYVRGAADQYTGKAHHDLWTWAMDWASLAKAMSKSDQEAVNQATSRIEPGAQVVGDDCRD